MSRLFSLEIKTRKNHIPANTISSVTARNRTSHQPDSSGSCTYQLPLSLKGLGQIPSRSCHLRAGAATDPAVCRFFPVGGGMQNTMSRV